MEQIKEEHGCASWEQAKMLEWYRKEAIRLHDRIHAEMVRADENEIRCARIEKQTIHRCAKVAYALSQPAVGDKISALIAEVFPVVERERRSWQNAME